MRRASTAVNLLRSVLRASDSRSIHRCPLNYVQFLTRSGFEEHLPLPTELRSVRRAPDSRSIQCCQLNYVRFLEHPVRGASSAANLSRFGTAANLITFSFWSIRGEGLPPVATKLRSVSKTCSAKSIHRCQLNYIPFLKRNGFEEHPVRRAYTVANVVIRSVPRASDSRSIHRCQLHHARFLEHPVRGASTAANFDRFLEASVSRSIHSTAANLITFGS